MDESKRARRSAAALAAPAPASARSRLLARCAFLAVLALILVSGPQGTAGPCTEQSECVPPALSRTAGILPALSDGTAGILSALSLSASTAPASSATPAASPESPPAAQQAQPPPPQQPPAASSQPPSPSAQQPTAPPRKKIASPPAQSAPPANGEGAANFRDDNPGERERWFYEQRAFPLGFIPFGIRQRAVAAREAMRDRERRLGMDPFPSARSRTAEPNAVAAPDVPPQTHLPVSMTNWTSIGPQPTLAFFPGVGNVSGRVSAVAVHPTNPDIVFIGGAQGGVWRSTNGGANWVPLVDDRESLAIGSIAIAPNNPQIIYVGTGEQTNAIGSYYGAGILKSMDGGNTWIHLPGNLSCGHVDCMGAGVQPMSFVGPHSAGFSPGGGARIASIAVHPSNPDILLAGVLIFQVTNGGASSGIYRSQDGGLNWTNVRPGAAGTEVMFDPADPMNAYAALGTIVNDPDNGIYKSTNGGMNWTKQILPSPATATNLGRIEIAIARTNPNTVYASVANGSTTITSNDLLAVFKTTNGGTTWMRLAPSDTRLAGTVSVCSAQCWYDHIIKVHPANENVVYLGGAAQGFGSGEYLLRSTDGGNFWAGIAVDAGGDRLHVDMQAMGFDLAGSRLYLGTDGGVWSADVTNHTGPVNWTNRNATLSLSQFYPGHSFDPSSAEIGYGGTQDNGAQKFDGLLNWQEMPVCGDGGFTAVDPDLPTRVYVGCQNIDPNRSTDSGGSFISISGSLPANSAERSAFIPPLVLDTNPSFTGFPARPLYFGTCRVWQSINSASPSVTWTAISPDLTTSNNGNQCPTSGSGNIRAIAIDPNESRIVYVGTSDGRIQRTLDASVPGLASWQDLTSTLLPPRTVTALAIDPNDSGTIYATFSGFSGFSGDNSGHVFRGTLTGAGISWQDISRAPFSNAGAELPNTPANDVVVDPNIPGTLYVATDVGVFVTSNGGADWQTLQSGLPNVAVLGLKLHTSRVLRAGTHGRGMWDLGLPAGNVNYQIQSLSPSNVDAARDDFTMSPNALVLTVSGIGFTSQSLVRWNGAQRTTRFLSSTQLEADILDSDIQSGGVAQITVVDPDPAKGISNSLPFSVNNPLPTLSAINPSMATPGGAAFTLTLTGSSFLSDGSGTAVSVARWNGSNRPTTFVASTELTAQIPASDIASPGINLVTVFNPGPGGGTSNSRTFTVGTPPPNDDFANAILITSNPFADTQDNSAGSQEPGEPPAPCAAPLPGFGNFHSIWYRFTPTANVTVTVDTNGSNFDTVLSVWTGAAVNALSNVACDDDGGNAVATGGRASRLGALPLTANTTYHFMVGGFCDPADTANCFASVDPTYRVAGTAVFNFSIPADFALSANPTAVTVARGQSGTSTITATPMNGSFGNAITFSCSGLPAQSACVFNPTSVTPGANPATTQLSITTTAPAAMIPGAPQSYRWPLPPIYMVALTLLALLLFAAGFTLKGTRATVWLLGGGAGRSRMSSACRAEARRYMAPRNRALARACHVAAVLILVGLAVACGGGGGGGGTPPPPNQGTPTGTFSVTVRGTAGAVQRTTVVTLTVQ